MYPDLLRQAHHWLSATHRLANFHNLASPAAWSGLEDYLHIALRENLELTVQRLLKKGVEAKRQFEDNKEEDELKSIIYSLRQAYRQTEVTLDFFGDAVNSRTSTTLATMLTALDILAVESMRRVLNPLQLKTPPVLTYIDKGLGASILKAGLRLWDGGTINPVAAIKIVRHNLLRPTALIHEAGHQVAHMVGWNEELAQILRKQLPADIAAIWASWASEIAADTFAFVNCGFAAVASLHDVLAGGPRFVFQFFHGDPHPIPFIRVLLGLEMCKVFYGLGPWDQMKQSWLQAYPIHHLPEQLNHIFHRSQKHLSKIANLILRHPLKAFQQKSITQMISPMDVHPKSLRQLAMEISPGTLESSYELRQEGLRLLALAGWQIAINPKRMNDILKVQERWMMNLGNIHSLIIK